ncbi:MAG: signal peptidase I [Planctomycetota bacterium]
MSDASKKSGEQPGGIKETITSLLIAFTVAMMFRSYVVEAFVIPTGSMAPTLLGQHMRFQSDQTGAEWSVDPWTWVSDQAPAPLQGDPRFRTSSSNNPRPVVTDPMSTSVPLGAGNGSPGTARFGYQLPPEIKPVRMGDRILVQKYLYDVVPPERYDVVVFKNPERTSQNYIKRLLGLPGEELWIVDGDVFARSADVSVQDGARAAQPTGEWQIQRKPKRVQKAVWQTVFSSESTPVRPVRDGVRWFVSPWFGASWDIRDDGVYRLDDTAGATLAWDTARWPVTNWTPYDETPRIVGQHAQVHGNAFFPVGDLRVRAGIKPDASGARAVVQVRSHGHDFQCVIESGTATLRMRPRIVGDGPGDSWSTIASAEGVSLPAGEVTDVAFVRVDQSLRLYIDGALVTSGPYDWSPQERLRHATGLEAERLEADSAGVRQLISAATYRPATPSIEWTFSGSPVTLYRVGLDRDLYWQPTRYLNGPRAGRPALGSHPRSTVKLREDEFFLCGDNSIASLDGRLWTRIDPEVANQLFDLELDYETATTSEIQAAIEPHLGIVPGELVLGKAFFVYFPSPERFGRIPIPNFGEMRFIR